MMRLNLIIGSTIVHRIIYLNFIENKKDFYYLWKWTIVLFFLIKLRSCLNFI